MSRLSASLAAAAAALVFAAPAAHASLGDTLVATGGEITLRFEGSDAAYDSFIGINALSVNGAHWLMPNHGTTVGRTLSLGSFVAGTVLDVQLRVVNTGDIFRTGIGSLNPDGQIHANVIGNWNGSGRTYVGFEDLFGGGDRDYNDHTFSFSNVAAVPEPSTYALMLAGLAGVGFVARRRRPQR